MRIFAPPSGYGPGKLGAFAALSFALAAFTLVPALDRDAGIPDFSALAEARGHVQHVSPQRYGVRFRLQGRAATFEYPSKARGYDIVKSALLAAGDREVSVLFDPHARRPWFSTEPYYGVWQLAVEGQPVRTLAEAKAGWRSDNAITPWLSAWFLLSGCYFFVSALRARRSREFR